MIRSNKILGHQIQNHRIRLLIHEDIQMNKWSMLPSCVSATSKPQKAVDAVTNGAVRK
jgi:hypothetical protein